MKTKSRMMIYGCPFQLSNCKDHGAADAKPHGNTDLQKGINTAVL